MVPRLMERVITHICWFTLALLFLLSSSWNAATAPAQATVGVVLDRRSDDVLGRKSLTCIEMAALEQPADVRDSRGDLTEAAAHAAEDKNAQVKAIVLAPQTLPGADSVAHLRRSRRHRYPILTLSKELRIAVPLKTGFQDFIDVKNPGTDRENITGYCIDVFKAAMSKLQSPPKYKFHVIDGPYDELISNVTSGYFDAAVGDVTITAERARLVQFTMPYTPSGLALLVLEKNYSKPIEWIFLKPLTTNLWLATVGGFFFTGLVVWIIEHPSNPEYQGSRVRQLTTAFYFAFSTLIFSHDQIIRSPLAKIVVVIWCFVVLIVVQSYTASLSSMLTVKRLRPSATGLDQLLLNGDYVGYQNGSFVGSLLQKRGFMPSRLRPYGTEQQYAEALRNGSMNGGVSAIVDEIPYLTSFLSNRQYQKEFQMVNRFYKTPGFGFVFPLGSPLVHDLSTAILNQTGENTEGSSIAEKWFGSAEQSTGSDDNPSSSSDSNPLTLQSFSGLFIITGCISALMLLISVVNRLVRATRAKEAHVDVQGGGSTSSATEESSPLQNVMDNNSAPNTVQEVGNDGFQGAQPMGGSDGDEGPHPMQNGTQNDPVPEHHVQMEMNTG